MLLWIHLPVGQHEVPLLLSLKLSVKAVSPILRIDLSYFHIIGHPPTTMVAQTASIVVGGRPTDTNRLKILLNKPTFWF